MTRLRLGQWFLPLRPRVLSPALGLIVLTFPYVSLWPNAVLFVGDQNYAPRPLSPFEYLPMALIAALGLGLAPRLPQWDRYGTAHTRWTAALCALATVVIPIGVFFLALLLYPPTGSPPAHVLIPIAGDIAVAGLGLVILLGTIGRLAGLLGWIAVLYATMLAQSTAPAWGEYLPLSIAYRPDLAMDTGVRWWWIAVLTILAGVVVWVRRSVSIRISLRPPEES